MNEIEIRGHQNAGPAITTEDIARRLAEIHAQRGDSEVAHGAADNLYVDVLAAIAAGAPNADLLAAAALKVEDIDFDRWYA